MAAAAVATGHGSVVNSVAAGAAVGIGAESTVGTLGGPYGDVSSGAATVIGAGAIIGNIYSGAAVSLGALSQSGQVYAAADISGSGSDNSYAYTDTSLLRTPIIYLSALEGIASITRAQTALSSLEADFTLGVISMGGQSYPPGVYKVSTASVAASTVVTFDANGETAPLWVINLGAALTVGAGTRFEIINAPQGGRIIWNLAGALTLGAGTSFIGSAFVNGAVTAATSVSCGNLWATAAIGIDSVTSELNGYDCSKALKDLVITDGNPIEPVPLAIDHYRLERNLGQGLTCEPLIITSRACLDADCNTEVSGLVSTEFAPSSGWTGGNTKTQYSSGTGFKFQLTSAATHRLAVLTSTPAFKPLADEPVQCYANGLKLTNCDLTFVDTALRFFDAGSDTSSTGLDLTAGLVSSFAMRLVATDESTGRCETQLLDGDRFTTTIGTECLTPDTCLADQQVIWRQTGLGPVSLPNLQDRIGGSATTSAQVAFDAQGDASFELSAPDVGLQSLKVAISLLDVDGSGTNELIEQSVTLRVRPASLVISAVGVGDTHIAGDPFDVTIHALGVNAAGATYVVPSFGRIGDNYSVNWSRSTLVMPTTTAVPDLVVPTIGTLTGASSPDSYTDTDPASPKESITFSGSNGLAYVEAGSINLVAQIDNYLGSNAEVHSPEVLAGRFIPAFLTATQVGIATWGGETSAYQGQPASLSGVNFNLEAFSLDGATLLLNYMGTGLDVSIPANALAKPIGAGATGGILDSDLTWTVVGNFDFDGIIGLSDSALGLTWHRNASAISSADTPQTLTSLQLSARALTDADGVCIRAMANDGTLGGCLSTEVMLSSVCLYYVRAALPDVIGAGSTKAYVPVSLEYFTGFDTNGNEEFALQDLDHGLDGNTFLGLKFVADTTCTLSSETDCSATADTSSFTGPNSTGTSLLAGEGLITVTRTTDFNGLMAAQLSVPSGVHWLSWDWDDSGDQELATTLLLLGAYQGRRPLLFNRRAGR
ncbi:DUF6701 domain-containing protein [Reinekea sp.]|uniref:DUF6701 domain-containing protein n=1 Tax=Reinekea sp. TaxID=1970455 RepID=UPI002A819650|nr:DUF6701 domain-containing protein [Reinekea sp.]